MPDHLLRSITRRFLPRAVVNAIRRPGATASSLWRDLASRLGRNATAVVDDDWRIACHPSSVAVFEIFRGDEDSREELRAFRDHCAPGMALFDLGCHHGFFTLAALRFGGAGARAVALDASPPAVRILRANLALNGAADRVTVVRSAVGEADGTLRMVAAGAGSAGYFLGTDEARPDAESMPSVTLDTLAGTTGLRPTHVKIDVEGFEGEVIAGGREVLTKHAPIVFLELHGAYLRKRGREPSEVLARLADLGYRRLLHGGRPIAPEDAASHDLIRLVCLPGD